MKNIIIVISILLLIVVVVSICTPSILDGNGISANEASAFAGLKMLVAQEQVWQQRDPDGNGIKDYWAYDLSCFNRMYRPDGITKIGLIDISFARADDYPATDTAFAGNPAIEPWIGDTLDKGDITTLTSKSGYWFRAMLVDEEGVPYNQNPVGANGVKACNSNKYAFVAYPDVVGTSGRYIHIVNEIGHVYSTRVTSENHKAILQWPGKDLTKSFGPDGYRWLTEEEYYTDQQFFYYSGFEWASFVPAVFSFFAGTLSILFVGRLSRLDAEIRRRNREFLTVLLISIIPVFIGLTTFLSDIISYHRYTSIYIKFIYGLQDISKLYRQAIGGDEELLVLEGLSFLVLSCSFLVAAVVIFTKRSIAIALLPLVLAIVSILTAFAGALEGYWRSYERFGNVTSAVVCFIIYFVLLWLFLRLVNKPKPSIKPQIDAVKSV
ncbi:MAG: hypothetical protein HY762_06075 [Planctomycetes bacterium]|nr:hypothetical protein [Planctomycetota bacterium]